MSESKEPKWLSPARRRCSRAILLRVVLLVCALSPARGLAQAAQRDDADRPRVNLDCPNGCDDGFYRQALSYFDWVRDRHDADFAISVVSQIASNGGWKYTVTLRRPQVPEAAAIVRVVTTQAEAPPAAERDKLLVAMLHCLYEALRGTPHEGMFELRLPRRSEQTLAAVHDGWDHWVFAPELLAEIEGESSYSYFQVLANFNVRRITGASKLIARAMITRRSVRYVLEDDEEWSGHTDSLSQRMLYAHSIGQHWALGALAFGKTSVYENAELHIHGGPVVEWNLFPYEENASRQLRLAYQAGAWFTDYFERTVFEQLRETRPYHALSLIMDLNQAWGSVQGVVQGNSFIDEPKRWRLSVGLVLSLSLAAGFALQFEGQAALIHDLVELRERELTDREILLELRELPKTVSYTAVFGFSYTFGSVHDTIVNPRFGRVDLEEDE